MKKLELVVKPREIAETRFEGETNSVGKTTEPWISVMFACII
jgi:hypothetical protein